MVVGFLVKLTLDSARLGDVYLRCRDYTRAYKPFRKRHNWMMREGVHEFEGRVCSEES